MKKKDEGEGRKRKETFLPSFFGKEKRRVKGGWERKKKERSEPEVVQTPSLTLR